MFGDFTIAFIDERNDEVHENEHVDSDNHQEVNPHGNALGHWQVLQSVGLEVANRLAHRVKEDWAEHAEEALVITGYCWRVRVVKHHVKGVYNETEHGDNGHPKHDKWQDHADDILENLDQEGNRIVELGYV